MTSQVDRQFRDLIQKRWIAQAAVRSFLEDQDFLPVEAPILVTAPGTEVYLQYFQTTWQDFQQAKHNLFLRSSPEIHLKQALAHGLERIYHLGKAFRNGGELSTWHHPEFTMLEWYQVGISFEDFMNQTYQLIQHVHSKLLELYPEVVRPSLPDPVRLSVFEAFKIFAQIELRDQDPDLASKAIKLGYQSIRPDDDFETCFFKVMLDVIEPRLKEMAAVFLYDYPPSQAALAMIRQDRAKRFELFLSGVEICNAFEELLDADENKQRIETANSKRALIGHPQIPADEYFLAALRQGIPPCCGNALGFDRLLAYLLQEPSLAAVIPFRQQKPFTDFISIS